MTGVSEHQDVVLALLRRAGKVLLVKQTYGGRLWTMPGGDVEAGESLADAAVREIKEETGLDVRPQGLFGVRNRPGQTLSVFVVEQVGGEMRTSVPGEIEAVGWFSLGDIHARSNEIVAFTRVVSTEALQAPQMQFLPLRPWHGPDGKSADLYSGWVPGAPPWRNT